VTHRPLQDWDEAAYDRLMQTNLKGPFFLIRALLPMLANPSSVILCGSVSAHIGLPQSSAYAASKAGLLSLARTLSGELVERGIRVNGLSPGPTETPAFAKLRLPAQEEDALRKQIRGLVPIGRMGTPRELAKAAVFLASSESSFVVGTELLVDGGVGNL
jgi:NAD(P)-dependent dehydrogenase (short-subunit alcohol dehydrogenase family)